MKKQATLEELGINPDDYASSFVFLWGFNSEGNPYLDMLAHGAKEIGDSASYLFMRERFQVDLKFGHWRAENLTKDDIYDYVDSAKFNDELRREVIENLKRGGQRGNRVIKPTAPETFIDSLRGL